MALTKDELLGQLFALRAGLSAISLETTKVKSDERSIEEEKQKVNDIYNQLSGVDIQKQSAVSQKAFAEKKLNSKISRRNKEIKERANDKISASDLRLKVGIACGVSALLSIVPIIMINANGYSPIFVIMLSIYAIVFIGAIVIYCIKTSNLRAKYTAEVDKEIEDSRKDIAHAEQVLSMYDTKRKEWEEIIEEMEEKRDDAIAGYEDSISEHAELALRYNSIMEESFGSVLNPADWQNIDLCIYYLQTGRAESLKECLQLADRQLQANEIINSVKQATERICSEIRSGFTALGKTMVACFNSVSAQIESLSNQMANEHNTVMRALENINSSNAAILSATQLNNALLAKAETSSEQLVKDLEYIKDRSY